MNQLFKILFVGAIMLTASESSSFEQFSGSRKYIDRTPDITTDVYWDSYDICVAQVAEIETNDVGKEQIVLKVTQSISGDTKLQKRTVPKARFWWWSSSSKLGFVPEVKKEDLLVLFIKKKGVSPIVAVKLDSAPNQSALVKTLSRIAQLRSTTDIALLSDGVFDPDKEVALYCANRMSTRSPSDVDSYCRRLEALLQDESTDVYVILKASILLFKFKGYPLDSRQEYAWLKTAISRSRQSESEQLWPLFDRLKEFDNNRDETVAFLLKLIVDNAAPQPLRYAAHTAIDDPRLFNVSKPDGNFEQVFATCIEMLQNSDPNLRASSAGKLKILCNRIIAHSADQAVSSQYVSRAKASVSAAIAVEKDEICLFHMRSSLEKIGVLAGED